MDVVNVDMKLVGLREDADEITEQHKNRRHMTEKKKLPQVDEPRYLLSQLTNARYNLIDLFLPQRFRERFRVQAEQQECKLYLSVKHKRTTG